MLTKEEYKILMNKINKSTGHGTIANAIQYFIDCLLEFTEKSTQKIQVGDIYRDDDEEIKLREIILVDTLNNYHSRCGYVYNSEGKYVGGCDMPDLDTSMRYKLVEIKDAD